MSNSICTSKCTTCKNCILIDTDKSKIKIYCKEKQKEYYYGQIIPCDSYDKER